MRKVLHVFKCIVLLVYLLALVLCCHSCIMTLFHNNLGASVKKREDMHKNAEANKAFAHFRW